MKVSIVSVPFVRDYMRNARCDFVSLSHTQWYPILPGWATAWLEGHGHTVQLIDGQVEETPVADVLRRVEEFRPDLVAVYGGLKSQAADLAFGDDIQDRTGRAVAYVGPYVSIDPASWVRPSRPAQFAVAGEFDAALGDLVQGHDPATTPNVWSAAAGARVSCPPRPYLTGEELDALPFVTDVFRRHLDLRRYKAPSEPYPFLDLMTGRGCAWGRCTYCLWPSTWVRGPRYAARSVDSVVAEFRFVQEKLPEIRSLMLQDDTLMADRAMKLSEALIRAGTRIRWSCYVRADLPADVLKAMRRAGCLNLHVGYESVDRDVLRAMKKGLERGRMERFTDDAKAAGLHIHGDFLVGFPGDTEASILETIDWSCRHRPDTAQYQVFVPYPGTPVYQGMKDNGWLDPSGEPSYPDLPRERLGGLSRLAYRRFYLSPQYLWQCVLHPWDRVFKRLDTYRAAIPAVFGRGDRPRGGRTA